MAPTSKSVSTLFWSRLKDLIHNITIVCHDINNRCSKPLVDTLRTHWWSSDHQQVSVFSWCDTIHLNIFDGPEDDLLKPWFVFFLTHHRHLRGATCKIWPPVKFISRTTRGLCNSSLLLTVADVSLLAPLAVQLVVEWGTRGEGECLHCYQVGFDWLSCEFL